MEEAHGSEYKHIFYNASDLIVVGTKGAITHVNNASKEMPGGHE